MSQGLSVSSLINVTVNLSSTAAQAANFDSLLIMGSSTVIDVTQRLRSYTQLSAVAADFGTTAPEYLAADDFFSQVPQPTQLYIGRWAQAASHGLLHGGALSASQQLMSNFSGISAGKLDIIVDGSPEVLTGIDVHTQTTLNGVASVVTTALSGVATCVWNSVYSRFDIISATTGTTSSVAFATTVSGEDLGVLMGLEASQGGNSVAGIAAETAVAATAIVDGMNTQFYGLMFASTSIVDADHLAIAAYVQGSSNPHIYGVGTIEASALNPSLSSDIGSELMAAGYTRTMCQWSSSDPYAVASLFGRMFTVDFTQQNSTITLMYKQEPGITAENLTASQAATLVAKRYNFFVNYNNGTAILQNGVMSGPAYIDEIHGTDWLANAIQTNVYNLLYTSNTKIPQTDAGTHQIVNIIEATCAAGVNNGLLAPGTWTSGGFGTLNMGDFLPKGFYVYAPPVSSQNAGDRAARKSVPIQVAAKLAGAVQSVNVLVNVNR